MVSTLASGRAAGTVMSQCVCVCARVCVFVCVYILLCYSSASVVVGLKSTPTQTHSHTHTHSPFTPPSRPPPWACGMDSPTWRKWRGRRRRRRKGKRGGGGVFVAEEMVPSDWDRSLRDGERVRRDMEEGGKVAQCERNGGGEQKENVGERGRRRSESGGGRGGGEEDLLYSIHMVWIPPRLYGDKWPSSGFGCRAAQRSLNP